MEISNSEIKINGLVEYFGSLEFQKDYNFNISGSVVKVEDRDNQDGTITKRYVFKVENLNE